MAATTLMKKLSGGPHARRAFTMVVGGAPETTKAKMTSIASDVYLSVTCSDSAAPNLDAAA